MTENERILMEATLEELKAAVECVELGIISTQSEEIILAALGYFIEAREMYGED